MVTVTFEHVDGSIKAIEFGPYTWVRIDNDVLKVSPDGEVIAINEPDEHGDAEWYLTTTVNGLLAHIESAEPTAYNHVIFRST